MAREVPRRSVVVVGAGYVGVATGAALARHGHDVTLVDLDPDRVDALRRGTAPFFEPGLDELVQEGVKRDRLHATTDLPRALADAEVVMIAVGTPSRDDGSLDLAQVRAAVRDVGRGLARPRGYPVVVVKSTVTPGTTRDVVRPLLQEASGRRVGREIGLAVNPEFLREGAAVADSLRPDRVVVGADDERSSEAVWDLYRRLDCPKLDVDPTTAEFIKHASNALLATKVTFANEMALLAEDLGVDVYDVMEGVGFDHRIEGQFLRAGAGIGGSCFPKDVRALAQAARALDHPSGILEAVLANLQTQPRHVVDLAEDALGTLAGKRVALLGLAFKPGTDDVRETRALPILQELEARGATVVCFDPKAMKPFQRLAPDAEMAASPEDALRGADACIVQTEWEAFRDLDPGLFRDTMATPVVVDGRRALDATALWAAGVDYRAVGLGTGRRDEASGATRNRVEG